MKDLIHIVNLGRIIILQDLIRPAVFVTESTLAKDLLKLFQKQRLHMAIVQDAGGRTAGLVTLEDLLERIVGDIWDEHDMA
jgi:CBS domain containing-hemolysin-like protein